MWADIHFILVFNLKFWNVKCVHCSLESVTDIENSVLQILVQFIICSQPHTCSNLFFSTAHGQTFKMLPDLSVNSIPGLSITVLHMSSNPSIANCMIFRNLLIIWIITCCCYLYFLGIMYCEELDFLLVLETEREKGKKSID